MLKNCTEEIAFWDKGDAEIAFRDLSSIAPETQIDVGEWPFYSIYVSRDFLPIAKLILFQNQFQMCNIFWQKNAR